MKIKDLIKKEIIKNIADKDKILKNVLGHNKNAIYESEYDFSKDTDNTERKGSAFAGLRTIAVCILAFTVMGATIYGGYKVFNKDIPLPLPVTSDKTPPTDTANPPVDIIQADFIRVSDNAEGSLILHKEENGEWSIAAKDAEFFMDIIGEYNNRLYFKNHLGVAYIDLSDSEYNINYWLLHENYYKDEQVDELVRVNNHTIKIEFGIEFGEIVGDTMYFTFSFTNGGDLPTDGLMSVKMTADTVDDVVQLDAEADIAQLYINKDKTLIYYKKSDGFGYFKGGVSEIVYNLFSYNINSGEISRVTEGHHIGGFDYYSDENGEYILHVTGYNSFNTIVTQDSYLYLYDIKTGDETIINEYLSTSVYFGNKGNAHIKSLAQYYNGDVYYNDGISLFKYNNGKKDIVYTYNDGSNDEYNNIYGCIFINENIIEIPIISVQNTDKRYLVNGVLKNSMPDYMYIYIEGYGSIPLDDAQYYYLGR